MNKEVWLIFRNGKHKLQRLMKDGFGHVAILVKSKTQWVLIAPNETKLEIIILEYNISDNAPQWLANCEDMKVVRVVYNELATDVKFPRLLIGFTCVSFVKYYLGYKDYSVTPYGLYKNLMKCKKNIIYAEDIPWQVTPKKSNNN